jgi:glycolate oxidase FAD binding subunit
MNEASLRALIDRVEQAAAETRPLRIRAGGSKDFYGEQLVGDVFDVSGYRGIVAYEPTELVITARCGTPLVEIEAALAAHQQCLPFEPPHFGGATVGGTVAAGLGGPGAAYAGRVRDYVLGARLIDGRGQDLRFGGTVMKNVAGYDVSRLLAGSLGTLGVISEVSLKVLPTAPATASLQFSMDQASAILAVNQWAGQALPLSGSAWHDGVLTLRLSGAHAAVRAALTRLGGEVMAPHAAVDFWRAVREQSLAFFANRPDDQPLIRVAVPATTAPLQLDGATMVEWGGAQRWLVGGNLAAVRAAAQAAGGHAQRFAGPRTPGDFNAPLPKVLQDIHRRLKAQFDPHGIFNPQRMFSEA